MQDKKFLTVGTLAKELNTTVEGLLRQLKAAGRPKSSARSQINEEDKVVLLDFLRSQNKQTGNPFIQVGTQEKALILDVQNSKNGSEYEALKYLVQLVLSDANVDTDFQNLANLIVCKAVLCNSLPSKFQGRPKSNAAEETGRRATQRYFSLLDQGVEKSEAVREVAIEFSKDERQIFRYLKKHRVAFLTPNFLAWRGDPEANELALEHYGILTVESKQSSEWFKTFIANPVGYIDTKLGEIPSA